MQKHAQRIVLFTLTLTIALAAVGCSKSARAERHVEKADKYFDSGKRAEAEIEYLNALKLNNKDAHAFAQLGLIYFDSGRISRAYPFLSKASELDPNNVSLHNKLGLLFLAAGDTKKAREQALISLQKSPTNSEAPLLLAEASLATNEITEARQTLEKIQKQSGQSAALEIALGTLSLRSGNAKAFEASVKHALTLEPENSTGLSALGTYYWSQRDLTNAAAYLKAAAEAAPPRSSYPLRYADFELKNGRVDESKKILTDLTEKTPDYLPAWTSLAEIALAQNQLTNAATLLSRALSIEPSDFNALLLNARLHLGQQETDKAVAELESLSTRYPKSAPVLYYLAGGYLMKQDAAKAFKTVNQAIALAPNYEEALLLQAQLNIRRDNPDAAIASMTQLLQRRPQLPQPRLLLVAAYLAKQDFNSALAQCETLRKTFPENPQVPLLTGNIYLQQKKTDEARKQFERAMELSPEALQPFEQLVNLDLSARQYDAAIKRIQNKITQWPKSPVLPVLLARVYSAQNQTNKVESELLKAIDLDPNYQPPYLLLAQLYVNTKQNEKALEKLKESVEKNPENVSALMQMGMIQSEQEDYKGARDSYEKLLKVNPKVTAALNNVAYLYSEKLDDLDKAYDAARQAHDLAPNDPSCNDTLGWILFKRGEYARALNFLQGSAEKLPDEPEVQFHLGMAYYMMNDVSRATAALSRAANSSKDFAGKTEASKRLAVLSIDSQKADASTIAALEKQIDKDPGDVVAIVKLAEIYQKTGNAEKAANAYRQAIEKNPKNAQLLTELSLLYFDKLKQPEQALNLVKDAYKLSPDDPRVSYALARQVDASGDHKWALSLLQTTAQKLPSNPNVLYALANALYENGRVNDAETTMRDALAAQPSAAQAASGKQFLDLLAATANPAKSTVAAPQAKQILQSDSNNLPAQMVVAVAAEQSGNIAQATNNYAQILQHYPDFIPALRNLVILSATDPNASAATYDLATKARHALPNDPEIAKALGILSYGRKDYTRAAQLLKEAVAKRPQDGEALAYLGLTQHELKQKNESRENLRKALTLNVSRALVERANSVLLQSK